MKKEKNDIRVEMVRMEGDIAPFVKVDYVDKYAQEHTGLMLVDSGSTPNVLSCEMADCIGMLCKLEDEVISVSSIAHVSMDFNNVRFSFALGGKMFHETFCINPQPLPIPHIEGMTVIGILGVQFMEQHRLVIDYGDYSFHTSEVSPNTLAISDCDFFFPMEIGLKTYGLPVLPIKQDEKELVTLVDTGATCNMIADQSLTDNNFECMRLEEKDVMMGVTGEVEVDEAIVRFNMVSLKDDDVCEISRNDHFKVLPYYVYTQNDFVCENNDEEIPPIEVLLGSPFMANEGWIIDFGAKIIYQLKEKFEYEEAV